MMIIIIIIIIIIINYSTLPLCERLEIFSTSPSLRARAGNQNVLKCPVLVFKKVRSLDTCRTLASRLWRSRVPKRSINLHTINVPINSHKYTKINFTFM